MTKVNFINASTVVDDADAAAVVAALALQVARDFSAAWGIYAELVFTPRGGAAMPGAWQVAILDDADQAGILGYHDTSKSGAPMGKIFAKTDKDVGEPWSVTASHELCELLGDPCINLTVLREEKGLLVAYENADAPESTSYAYQIDGMWVSDFVFPSWFEPFWKRGETRFDQGGHIKEPFELLPGGYIGVYDVRGGSGWQQLLADGSPVTARKARAPVGSRRDRRRTPRAQWVASTA